MADIYHDMPRAPHGPPKPEEEKSQEAEVDLSDDGTVEKPINREPPMKDLIQTFITNLDNYDRNHGEIQHRSSSSHKVTIDGVGIPTPISLNISHLATEYSQHTITCAIQCAGNRRHTMRSRIKEVQGVDWFDAAVMNCTWSGPRLREILLKAGVSGNQGDWDGKHVQFASYGGKVQEDDWYGGSIPLERAMKEDMDVLIAIKMNDHDIPTRHGYPVRSIVPGVLGARSVKWLDRITIATSESPNYYQKHDYKILPPDAVDAETAEKHWDTTEAMLDMPVNCCVASPMSESQVEAKGKGKEKGIVQVKGYSVPQGSDGPVVRVQVSGDNGKTWVDASLDNGGDQASKWSWVLWSADVEMEKGKGKKIFAKATDRGGNTQEKEQSTWNLRGVAYNGYEAVYDLTVV